MSYQSRYRIAEQPNELVSPASPSRRLRQRLGAMLMVWRERVMIRRHLAAMDARSLRDAGISPAAAAYESGKSFWESVGPLR